jgi:NAD(P)-dependent dehydrogenase (short-subunit alcohol dehydrogenase family)
MGFSGKTVVVTGGASGIGQALGVELVAQGADVVLADIDEKVEAAAAAITGPGSAVGRVLDVRDREAVAALVDEVIAAHGHLDVLFNNAGFSVGGPTHELSGAHWDRALDVNLGGVVNGILAAYPRMVAAGQGHIVNTASAAGLVPPAFVAPYAAAKSGVVGLTTALRPEAARHGVKVSVLCPGSVDTPILDRIADDLPGGPSAPVTGRQFLGALRQKPVAPEGVARTALRQVDRNRAIIVVPARAKMLWYVARLSPPLAERVNRWVVSVVTRELIRPAD